MLTMRSSTRFSITRKTPWLSWKKSYHAADQWKIPRSFADQFDVDDDVKDFLLDYRYVLFDTNPWDFRDESKIDGGEFMPTLAQQMKEEFMQTIGTQLKDEGKKEGKIETAKQMLLDNFPLEQVIKYTGLTEREVKALIH